MLDKAVTNVLASGLRTADIRSDNTHVVGTAGMGDAIIKELQHLAG
jgi:3-isopropylmalate dehydrogenase